MENKVKPNGKATFAAGGKSVELPVYSGTVGPDVIDIGKLYAQTGMFTLDPGFTSTASCESQITYIDGDQGILLHRGYPIDQLAEQSNFLEVCYLLLHGELPNAEPRTPSSRTRSRATRCCTRSLIGSSRASAATPTRWRSCAALSARCRPSTMTPPTSMIRSSARSPSTA